MRKVLCALSVVVVLASCSARKKAALPPPISHTQAQRNNKEIQKARSGAIANATIYTADSYIQRFKAIAIQEMNTYGIPASITLAQGLFE